MRPGTLLVHVRRRGGAATIRCSGELDAATCDRLAEAIDACLDDELELLRIDCSRLVFIAGAGADVLAEASERCSRMGVALEVTMNPRVRRILDLAGLWWLGVLQEGASEDAALEHATSTPPPPQSVG